MHIYTYIYVNTHEQAILENIAIVKNEMQSESLAPAARSIMTTDRYPKLRGLTVGSSGARIVGIAKGAGMVRRERAPS